MEIIQGNFSKPIVLSSGLELKTKGELRAYIEGLRAAQASIDTQIEMLITNASITNQ